MDDRSLTGFAVTRLIFVGVAICSLHNITLFEIKYGMVPRIVAHLYGKSLLEHAVFSVISIHS